jgi:hypothetical protein
MSLILTLTGNTGNYLIRGAIWELGASSYRAYVHLVPSGARRDVSRSVASIVSVAGPTSQKVLDAAITRVMSTAGAPVQDLQVRAAPQHDEAREASLTGEEAASERSVH